MEMTAGVDLEVPGHPIDRAAATQLKGPPPRVALRAKIGTTGGKQLRLPSAAAEAGSAHAAGRARDRGDRRRHAAAAARWHVGVFLWSEGSAEPRPSSPAAAPPSRDGGLGPARLHRGTCLPAAQPLGPAPTPPGRHLSGRRPGNCGRQLGVSWGGAANHGTWRARSILGGKAALWELGRRTRRRAEVRRRWPLGVARCAPASRALPSAAFRLFFSTDGAPGRVPSLGVSRAGSGPDLKELVVSQAKRNPQDITAPCPRKMGFVIPTFLE